MGSGRIIMEEIIKKIEEHKWRVIADLYPRCNTSYHKEVEGCYRPMRHASSHMARDPEKIHEYKCYNENCPYLKAHGEQCTGYMSDLRYKQSEIISREIDRVFVKIIDPLNNHKFVEDISPLVKETITSETL